MGDSIVLDTDLEEGDAEALAREIDRWRAAMTVAVFPGARPPGQRLEVIAFRNRELEALNPSLGGTYDDERYIGVHLLVGGLGQGDRIRAVKHELAHAVIHENLPHPPQWLDEGLAKYLETMELDEATGELTWGALEWSASEPNPNPLKPSKQVLDVSGWPPEHAYELQYSAGIMVHMLARRHPFEFRCLLSRLKSFEGYDDAMERCFARRDNLGLEYSNELYEPGGVSIGRSGIVLAKGNWKVERLPDADVYAILAFVERLVAYPWKSERGERLRALSDAHRRRALELRPTQMLAFSMAPPFGIGRDVGGRLTADLVRDNPDDWRAWYWRALVLVGPVSNAEAANAVDRLTALGPARIEVIEVRAVVAANAHQWDRAIELARKALAFDPTLDIAWGVLFLSLEQLGRCDEVHTLLASHREEASQWRAHLRLEGPRPHPCADL